MSITPEIEVTADELAALVGVSARRIRQLAEAGILERVARGRYVLGPAIQALLEDAADNASELQRQRTRKVKADADRAELELARSRGEVAPITEMENLWSKACALVRTNMRNIPGRVVTRIVGESDEHRIKAALLEEIDTTLRALAEGIEEQDFNDDEDEEPIA